MRATMKEFGQLNDCTTAITGHSEVAGTPNEWDFWLITTDVNDAVRNLWSNTSQPGLVMTGPQYRLWIMTCLSPNAKRTVLLVGSIGCVLGDQCQRQPAGSALAAVQARGRPRSRGLVRLLGRP
jgi:hypothetical protein